MIDDKLNLPIIGQIETEPLKRPIETSIDQELLRIQEACPFYIAEIGLKGGAFVKLYGELRNIGLRRLIKAERLELDEEHHFPAYVLGLVSDRDTKRLAFAHNAIPSYDVGILLRFPVIGTVSIEDIIAYNTHVPTYRLARQSDLQELSRHR